MGLRAEHGREALLFLPFPSRRPFLSEGEVERSEIQRARTGEAEVPPAVGKEMELGERGTPP